MRQEYVMLFEYSSNENLSKYLFLCGCEILVLIPLTWRTWIGENIPRIWNLGIITSLWKLPILDGNKIPSNNQQQLQTRWLSPARTGSDSDTLTVPHSLIPDFRTGLLFLLSKHWAAIFAVQVETCLIDGIPFLPNYDYHTDFTMSLKQLSEHNILASCQID